MSIPNVTITCYLLANSLYNKLVSAINLNSDNMFVSRLASKPLNALVKTVMPKRWCPNGGAQTVVSKGPALLFRIMYAKEILFQS